MTKGIRSFLAIAASAALLTLAVTYQAADPKTEAPRWWKGNLHTHSLWSDGDDFPEMIADWYKRHGYHFLALSDHNVLSEGERWIDAETAEEQQGACQKYRARFGDAWVEERQDKGKAQVRLKPLREFRSLLEEPGRFLLIPGRGDHASLRQGAGPHQRHQPARRDHADRRRQRGRDDPRQPARWSGRSGRRPAGG